MKQLFFILLVLPLFFCALSCGDDDDDNDDNDAADDDDAGGDPFEQIEVTWVPCSLHDGQNDGRAWCASTEMPFDWDNPDGLTFTSYAKWLPSQVEPSEGQLWLLHGGPGASGTIGLPYAMEFIQTDYPELDIYTLDPRGSGYCDYVGCPDQEDPDSEWGESITMDEMPDCVAWLEKQYGEDLGVFNTTNSAIDLAAYIHTTRTEGKNVLIWGGSGGTFWGQRYLQMYPDQADGIVLEGIVPPITSLVFQDEYGDIIGRTIFQMCAQDDFCSSKLPDPKNTFVELLAKLDQGHCPELGIDSRFVIEMINYLAFYHPHHTTIPAFVFRLDRCDPQDVDAIVHFYYQLFGGEELYNGLSFSYVLFYNEICSEMWEYPWFADNGELVDYLDEVYAEAIIASGMGYDRNEIYLMWPRYTDERDDLWATTDIPMLMLQGIIDPSTPYDFAKELEGQFTGEKQHFVAFPYAPHNVTNGSPISEDTSAMHCGQKLFVDFLKDPTGDLDTSCVGQTLPLDFQGTAYGAYFFDTNDYWENAKENKGFKPAGLPEKYRVVQSDLARRLRHAFARQALRLDMRPE